MSEPTTEQNCEHKPDCGAAHGSARVRSSTPQLNAALKPCPLCGGQAQIVGACLCFFLNNISVRCQICELETKYGQFDDANNLVRFWNTRSEVPNAEVRHAADNDQRKDKQ